MGEIDGLLTGHHVIAHVDGVFCTLMFFSWWNLT